jgi:hexokinase
VEERAERLKIKQFLQKYRLDASEIDFEENCRLFMNEMTKGLEGKESSLAMLPTYLEISDVLPEGEPVLVLDAGGTNLRAAVVRFSGEKKPIIENFAQYPIPGTHGETGKEEFFQGLAEALLPLIPLAPEGTPIGFCFSYPTEMTPDLDGRLLKLTKEIAVRDVEGAMVGENLFKALRQIGYRGEKKIVVLNDTVATLLAGQTVTMERCYDSFISLILGTGTNTAYIEENSRIKKLSGLASGRSMIINVEAGSYAQAPRGKLDLELDRELSDPGFYVFEKMISGAYLGKLVWKALQKAAAEGIFSPGFTRALSRGEDLKTRDVNDFLHYPPGAGNPLYRCIAREGTENLRDSARAYRIMDGILERAALLTAINLSALILKTGKGLNPCRPVCITAEGTTFYSLKGFKNWVDYYLKKYLVEERGIFYEFVRVDHATLTGAAIAALTKFYKRGK